MTFWKEGGREGGKGERVRECVCVCVCVREREREVTTHSLILAISSSSCSAELLAVVGLARVFVWRLGV